MGVKTIWAGDFHDAYKRSLKVKRLRSGAMGVDAQAAWLYRWLIENKHVIPGKYKVVAHCAVCKQPFDPKKWDGTILAKGEGGNLVCPKCVKKAKREATRRPKAVQR